MLLKFSCGCIGLAARHSHMHDRIIVKRCDTDQQDPDPYTFELRRMTEEQCNGSVPISELEEQEIVNELGSLIGAGYRFREVRKLFGVDVLSSAVADTRKRVEQINEDIRRR